MTALRTDELCSDLFPDLVLRAKQGDEQAFEKLVSLYARPVHRVAHQILSNREDAEDIVQEAWMIVLYRLHTPRDPSSFGSWLYRIVANAAIRQRQRRSSQSASLDAIVRDISTSTGSESTDQSEVSADYRRFLPVALNALSNKDHLVVALHYFTGMQISEIANLLDVPVGTVKSRLYHARTTIRKELKAMTNETSRSEHVPPDFRKVIHGMAGEIAWQQLFKGSLEGWSLIEGVGECEPTCSQTPPEHWRMVRDGLIGQGPHDGEGTCLVIGDSTWRDYELSMLVTPLAGGNAQVFFRMEQEPLRAYVFDMMLGWQAFAIHRLERTDDGVANLVRLSVVNYPLSSRENTP